MMDIEKKKIAFITGITGQDGAYLAEFLLKKSYVVHGLKRRGSSFNTDRIDHLYQSPQKDQQDFFLHYGDLSDSTNLIRIIQEIEPDEIYNLGSQSHVQVSFEMPEYTANVDGLGILRILEAVRILGLLNKTKIFQASTAELYGMVQAFPQTESSAFYPRSPYAIAKLYAHWLIINYREAYNVFACNGILFNHESPTRGETFVTRKIVQAVIRIALGLQNKMFLGNLSAKRDWGHAKDYVEAMWLSLQQSKPEDYVISTGITTSVRDFVRMSFAEIGVEIEFSGRAEQERGVIIDKDEERLEELGFDPDILKMGQTVVKVDARYYRPTEVDVLVGDSSKIHSHLNWKPKYTLEMIVSEMIFDELSLKL